MILVPKTTRTTTCYIYIMFVIFPLFMWNGFVDIKESKMLFFFLCTGIFYLISMFLAWREKIEPFSMWRDHKCFILFIVIGAVGAICSANPFYAMTGYYGRYNGLLTVIAYLLIGNMLMSYAKFQTGFLYGFEMSGAVAAILGVLNYYGIDLLHVYDHIGKKSARMYVSTFGHVNIYTSFLSILLPVYAVSFFTAKTKKQMAFHMIGYCISVWALLVSGSDSGYLALAALWIILLVRSLRTKKGRVRVLGLLLVFAVIVSLVSVTSPGGKGKKKKMDSISKAIITLDFDRISDYFEFDDDWGSGRGFIWSRGLSYYSELPVQKKLVGIGPDMLLPAMAQYCGEESLEKFGVYYDNMHNELFQALLTYGALGTLFLIIWILKMAWQIWRKSFDSPICFMVFTMMLCYGAQSLVNISTISVKALVVIWLFLAQKENKKSNPKWLLIRKAIKMSCFLKSGILYCF